MIPCEGIEDFRMSSKMAPVQDYSNTLRASLFPTLHSGLTLPICKSKQLYEYTVCMSWSIVSEPVAKLCEFEGSGSL